MLARRHLTILLPSPMALHEIAEIAHGKSPQPQSKGPTATTGSIYELFRGAPATDIDSVHNRRLLDSLDPSNISPGEHQYVLKAQKSVFEVPEITGCLITHRQ